MRKSLFFVILSMVLLAACGGGRRYSALMHEADSLLTAGEATSAYTLLAEADSQKTAWSRRQRMAYELLKAQAQNQAYVDFQTDSVLRIVARYYDRHGTANERLKAHYLLGCTYRDLHEAPLAILSWEDAIASADTTAADCDYATLFRVYGQMADVYFRQFMPEKQLEAQHQLCRYALLAGDTLNYIRGLLKQNSAYLSLNDTIAVFQNIKYVRKLYLERGLTAEAARVYPTAIAIALDSGQYARAHAMMLVFEKESGLFDEWGNIARGYERYYYHKGRYFMAMEQVDSAEHYFHRLLSLRSLDIDGYRGLLYVFKYKGRTDSVLKYNRFYEDAVISYLNNTKVNAITQAEGMYDYHRNERTAKQQEKKARQRGLFLILVIAVGSVGIMLIYGYFRRKKNLREKEFLQTSNAYLNTKEKLLQAQKEIQILRDFLPEHEATKKLLSEKEAKINELDDLVKLYQKQLGYSNVQINEELLMQSDIVVLMNRICHLQSIKKNSRIEIVQPRALTDAEWQELMDALQTYHIKFFHFITVKHHLPPLQYKVCILSRLHFGVGEMSVLIDTSMSNVSNARRRAVQKLFNSQDTSLLDRLLSEI